MDLSKIVSISGKPGLYEIVGHMKNGIIVAGLSDGKRFPAYLSQKISALGDISMYTDAEDVPLSEVILNLAKAYDFKPIEDKEFSGDDYKAVMGKGLENFDEDRIYTSDIKKLIKWYNVLLEMNLINEADEQQEEAPLVEDAEVVEDSADSEATSGAKA